MRRYLLNMVVSLILSSTYCFAAENSRKEPIKLPSWTSDVLTYVILGSSLVGGGMGAISFGFYLKYDDNDDLRRRYDAAETEEKKQHIQDEISNNNLFIDLSLIGGSVAIATGVALITYGVIELKSNVTLTLNPINKTTVLSFKF